MKNSPALALAAAEEVVFLAAGAVCALQAADEEDGNANGDNYRDGVLIRREPVGQTLHI